jgi:alanyl-tRNA synthetase
MFQDPAEEIMLETKRLYHDDARLKEFDARVIGRKEVDGRPALILDQTAFYPESGGQSSDRGTIGGIEVLDVQEDGEAIVHLLAGDPGADAVHGKIDWPRRFDRMQQHSGQHILSQAFLEVLKAETLSFHIGDEVATLEIGIEKISDEALDKVEARANAAVFEDLEIKTYFVTEEKIGTIPLRRPPKVSGVIRIVEVDGFDHSACGGTHCRRSGEIGLIKIVRWERIRGRLRFEFVCGGRALRDYQEKDRIVRRAAAILSAADRDVPAAIEKAQGELRNARKDLRRIEESLAAFEARQAVEEAQRSGRRIIRSVFTDKSPDAARTLALRIIRQADVVVLFGVRTSERSHVIMARAENLAFDLRTLIPAVSPAINGRGGGSPSLVQIAGDPGADLDAALEAAESCLKTLES